MTQGEGRVIGEVQTGSRVVWWFLAPDDTRGGDANDDSPSSGCGNGDTGNGGEMPVTPDL
jgi:hypothetical protein